MVESFREEDLHNVRFLVTMELILTGLFIGLGILSFCLEKVVYNELSSNFSKYNQILQMIPFDVLVENPYIKLYLKN